MVTASDVSAAIPLARPTSSTGASRKVTMLQLDAEAPSRRKLFGSRRRGGISVTVDPSPVPDGPFEWATQVRFPRGVDVHQAFARVGLEWPVWWAVGLGEMTTLIEKIRMLTFVGFADPALALPWFVRLHAAATGAEPHAPVRVTGSVSTPLPVTHHDNLALDVLHHVQASAHSDRLKLQAYEEWRSRAAEAGDDGRTG